MASNVVRVSASEAQASLNNLNNKLSELRNKINSMRTRVNSTEAWWEGDTGRSFRQSFDRACKYFDQTLTTKIQDHANKMVKSVQAQQTQDSNMASRIVRH